MAKNKTAKKIRGRVACRTINPESKSQARTDFQFRIKNTTIAALKTIPNSFHALSFSVGFILVLFRCNLIGHERVTAVPAFEYSSTRTTLRTAITSAV
jgi:hypothetical protein